jgi:aldehyde dehydrogenase (NAD+)
MDLSAIVKNQRDYFNTGATRSVTFRRNALRKLYKAIVRKERMLFDALKADLNKSDFEAYMTEVGIIRDECRFAIKHLRGWARTKRAVTPIAQFVSKSFVIKEPYGVALIMSPWNYPFQLTMAPLIGAIAAGNCVVIKPSAYSPATSKAMSELISGIFPPEYIKVIQGGRAENAALLELQFDYIFFTGSTSVGHLVMEKASKYLTPISLELGAWGKYLNAGQTCVAPDYVLVHESKKEELIKELRRAIKEFFPAAIKNEDYVRIINEKQFDRLLGLLENEKAVIGGKYDRAKLRIVPTVLVNVTFDSKVMGEEIFGPILPILTYQDLDEAIALLRDKPKPLAMYLFTKKKATEKKVLQSLSFGGGCVNDTIIHLATSHMGFGGVGSSGMGAYHGKLSFDTFTHCKSIVDKKTWIDLPMRYRPYSDFKYKLIRMFLK